MHALLVLLSLNLLAARAPLAACCLRRRMFKTQDARLHSALCSTTSTWPAERAHANSQSQCADARECRQRFDSPPAHPPAARPHRGRSPPAAQPAARQQPRRPGADCVPHRRGEGMTGVRESDRLMAEDSAGLRAIMGEVEQRAEQWQDSGADRGRNPGADRALGARPDLPPRLRTDRPSWRLPPRGTMAPLPRGDSPGADRVHAWRQEVLVRSARAARRAQAQAAAPTTHWGSAASAQVWSVELSPGRAGDSCGRQLHLSLCCSCAAVQLEEQLVGQCSSGGRSFGTLSSNPLYNAGTFCCSSVVLIMTLSACCKVMAHCICPGAAHMLKASEIHSPCPAGAASGRP